MKVLEITFVPPDKKSGGGLGVYQSIKSLAGNCEVDYIGPAYEIELFSDTINKVHIHTILKSKKESTLLGIIRFFTKKVSTSFYYSWMNCKNHINWEQYDFVHIEFSRYSFLINECHKYGKKCMIRIHNIEKDYAYNIYRMSRTMANKMRYYSFWINEKKVMKDGDMFIFLTNEDIKRAIELYNLETEKITKNPVCIDEKGQFLKCKKINEKKNILITGSLSYAPNIEGVLWFLNNVWEKLSTEDIIDNAFLTIAGAHPNESIKEAIKKYPNVRLIDTPNEMESLFRNADIYIAAVFDGAGMKVKVAEAFSYGLPIIGTKHAFIGYEDLHFGKYIADSESDFIRQIKDICCNRTLLESREKIYHLFCINISMRSSIQRYKEYISKIGEK